MRLRDTGSQAPEAERATLVNALAIASDRAAEIDAFESTVPVVRPGAVWCAQYRFLCVMTLSGGGASQSVWSSVCVSPTEGRVVAPSQGTVQRGADAPIGLRADHHQSPDTQPGKARSREWCPRMRRHSSSRPAALRRLGQPRRRSASRRFRGRVRRRSAGSKNHRYPLGSRPLERFVEAVMRSAGSPNVPRDVVLITPR